MTLPEEYEIFMKAMHSLSGIMSSIEPVRNEIIQELELAKGRSLPDKLYHYTNTKGLNGIIQSNNLWASDFRSLNDSTELVYGTNLLIEELDESAKEYDGFVSELLLKLSNLYKDHGDAYRDYSETYIISFSEDPDVLSQWRAYSDQAIGCCVEFDFTDSHLFTITGETSPWSLEILPVIYDKSLQSKLIRSGISKLLNYLNSREWAVENVTSEPEAEQGIILGLLMHAFKPFITSFKYPGFSEELEWRAIASGVNNIAKADKKERITNSVAINYLECIFIQDDDDRLWQRELLPITGIKYGPLAENSPCEEIKKYLELNGYKDLVTYSRSGIPLKK